MCNKLLTSILIYHKFLSYPKLKIINKQTSNDVQTEANRTLMQDLNWRIATW